MRIRVAADPFVDDDIAMTDDVYSPIDRAASEALADAVALRLEAAALRAAMRQVETGLSPDHPSVAAVLSRRWAQNR